MKANLTRGNSITDRLPDEAFGIDCAAAAISQFYGYPVRLITKADIFEASFTLDGIALGGRFSGSNTIPKHGRG